MKDLQKELKVYLLNSRANMVGFANVSDVEMWSGQKIPGAISLGVAYEREILTSCDEDVDAFENHLQATKKKIASILLKCEEYLEMKGFRVWIPPISTNLPGLLSDFSHKTAATKAGLGWIGKNCLFVSSELGCGVRLATVLTDAPLVAEMPMLESRCGECMKCVEACPYGAIKGVAWHPGIERENLFDAFLCSSMREKTIAKLGYKHPCALCIKACPVGSTVG